MGEGPFDDEEQEGQSPVVAATAICSDNNRCAPPSTEPPMMEVGRVGTYVCPSTWTPGHSLRALERMVRYSGGVDGPM
jgi:hypothetical protein